jgi:extracellular factor (EF) 3-hydroxypalmitic acid methyl ester biosynthesis protein
MDGISNGSGAAISVAPISRQPARKRTQRLRSNRSSVPPIAQAHLKARCEHASFGAFDASVQDLSIHGVALSIDLDASVKPAILLGDQLTLVVRCDQTTIYQGAGSIARIAEGETQVVLGIALEGSGLDLSRVQHLSVRETVSERWQRARAAAAKTQIDPAFRLWLSDLASQLEQSRSFLDGEETAMASWDLVTRQAHSEELLRAVAPDVVALMNRAGSELRQLVAGLDKEQHESYRALLQGRIGSLLACSPFLARAKAKPLGYAGDYEMMNMLYRDHREGATLFGKVLNVYAAQQPVARANINRIEFIGAKIREALRKKRDGRVRITSIGCGPAHEVFTFLSRYPELGPRLDVALIDQEERAIAHCERTLAPLAAATQATVRVIKASARRLLTDQKIGDALHASQLVYSAGLFDYLADRSFAALLAVLYGAVAPGGTLLVGNVAADNPDRAAMEYFTEWFLYHRSPGDLLAHAAQLQPAARNAQIETEPTGVNLFLVLER